MSTGNNVLEMIS